MGLNLIFEFSEYCLTRILNRENFVARRILHRAGCSSRDMTVNRYRDRGALKKPSDSSSKKGGGYETVEAIAFWKLTNNSVSAKCGLGLKVLQGGKVPN